MNPSMNTTHARRWLAPLTLATALALLAACGSGGDDNSPDSTPPTTSQTPVVDPPNDATPQPGTYDVAAQIAAIRRHAAYGGWFTAAGNAHAPNGLALPTPPRADCLLNTVTVSSLTQFNTEAAGACKRITLAPRVAPYAGAAVITGQDIEAVFTGTTVTPTDDSHALQVVMDARRVKTVGGTFNNLYIVGGRRWSPTGSLPNFVEDVHIHGASFSGLYTQGLSATYYGDGAPVLAHRFLLERSSVRTANGGFFVESGSSNVILANSNIVVPKLDRHENPVRVNGADLVAIIDSRLRTELGPGQSGSIKHTWRVHASYDAPGTAGGRMIVLNVQSEGGGAMAQYPGVEGPDSQSTRLVVQGWRYHRASDVEGNNIAAFPHLNTYAGSPHMGDVMNESLWMDDNTVFHNDQIAGGSIMTSNVPPGSVTNSVYAPYVAPPPWSFR